MKFFSSVWGCHQIPERSFFLLGYQLPLCARCTGIFLGIAGYILIKDCCDISICQSLILMIPMVCDGGYQLVTSYESNNTKRVVSGFIFGIALSNIIYKLIIKIIGNVG